nr:hypothetical protein [uncultured Flavobacterium sp.]
MKKRIYYLVFILASFIGYTGYSQSYEEPEALGLPGDNLNLYAVLDIFQKSATIEKFEQSLNDDSSKINNLDLDNDGKVDFIKVKTEKEGDNFMFVLQVELNKNDVQDVAVVFVNKDKSKKITIQIVGDENLYGKNYVVEPLDSKNATTTANPGYTGTETVTVAAAPVSVAVSPVVVYLYSPVYVPYYPPYYYGYYPPYFRPWAPLYFSVYYHNHYHYHNHYYRPPYYHYPSHYNNYYSRRSTSVVVVNNTRNGNYKRTYNGNNYRKPNNPTTRPSTRPNNRPTTPSSRPTSSSTARPSARPTAPSTRPASPSTARPSTSPTRPSTRPVSPSKTRPATPTARPVAPVSRPASTTRSSNQTARPANTRSSSNQSNERQSSQRNR